MAINVNSPSIPTNFEQVTDTNTNIRDTQDGNAEQASDVTAAATGAQNAPGLQKVTPGFDLMTTYGVIGASQAQMAGLGSTPRSTPAGDGFLPGQVSSYAPTSSLLYSVRGNLGSKSTAEALNLAGQQPDGHFVKTGAPKIHNLKGIIEEMHLFGQSVSQQIAKSLK